jgi:hypothetical protein
MCDKMDGGSPTCPIVQWNSLECASLGIIGMSLNGVPAYGAQEGGGTNAVEGGYVTVLS